MDEREPSVYIIPKNFISESTILGGKIQTRRAAEAGILLFVVYEFATLLRSIFHFSWIGMAIILAIFGTPLVLISIFGFNDGPLSEFVVDFIRHIRRKRIVYYDSTVYGLPDTQPVSKEEAGGEKPINKTTQNEKK